MFCRIEEVKADGCGVDHVWELGRGGSVARIFEIEEEREGVPWGEGIVGEDGRGGVDKTEIGGLEGVGDEEWDEEIADKRIEVADRPEDDKEGFVEVNWEEDDGDAGEILAGMVSFL